MNTIKSEMAGFTLTSAQEVRRLIKLKNGIEEPDKLVAVVMLALKILLKEKPLVFHDLVMLCRNGSSPWSDMTPAKDAGLLQPDGKVHDSIRHVILSAVEGDGLDMVLGEPVAS